MNPRVSRSSALASKATGFPIAKIAARLAVGYTLDEISNDITGETPASFEPTLDYVVVKVPRFAFEKFPGADPDADDDDEVGRRGDGARPVVPRGAEQGAALHRDRATRASGPGPTPRATAARGAADRRRCPRDGRLYAVERALRFGATVAQVARPPGSTRGSSSRSRAWWRCAARSATRRCSTPRCCAGPSARACPTSRSPGRAPSSPARTGCGRCATASACGRSTRPSTPAPPSSPPARRTTTRPTSPTPPRSPRSPPQTERPKVIILGSGPNRIGQGIEFDYSCVHAATSLRAAGFETVMLNCNPETVSTDYDTADRLYFEPLTEEDVLEVVHAERLSAAGQRPDADGPGPGLAGVVVQLGGQTPLKLAPPLEAAGVPIVGTPPAAIDLAEERGAFGQVLADAGLPAPPYGTATQLRRGARDRRGDRLPGARPARPTCWAGGAWRSSTTTRPWPTTSPGPPRSPPTTRCSSTASSTTPSRSTSTRSATRPARSTSAASWSTSRRPGSTPATRRARCRRSRSGSPRSRRCGPRRSRSRRRLGVLGLMNVQYALKDEVLYVLEANPRASRTVPFVSKATGVPLASAAARVMLGATIAGLRREGVLPAAGDGGHLPARAPGGGQGGRAAVPPLPRAPTGAGWTRCSARR